MSNPIGIATNIATGGMVGYQNGGFSTGAISGAADNALTGGKVNSEMRNLGNGLMDVAFGKKTPGTPDQVIDLASPTGRALQENALGKYGDVMNQDVGQLAGLQIDTQSKLARAQAGDQERLAKQMVAQRGLGGTSLGLNAIIGQKANLGNKLNDIAGQRPMLENQMRQQNLGFASQGINQILNEQGQSKVLKMGQQAQGRSGGLMAAALPIAGQVLGGMAGSGAFNGLVGGAGSTAAGYSAATTPFVGGGMGRNPYA